MPAAPEWEQVITPLGPGFESTWVGGWVKIGTQNPVYCSTDAGNAIYTRTRTPGYSDDRDWARWRPTLPSSGQYGVYVYIPDYRHYSPVTSQARYKIHHAGGDTVQVIDQNQNKCTWVYLGQYQFDPGTEGYVYMGDYTGDDPWHLIAADGVKFVQVTSDDVVVLPLGTGFESTWVGGWVRIRTQNTVSCSTDANNVIYTRTRTPGYSDDADWARWRPTLPLSGDYQVYAYIPDYTHSSPITSQARYKIHYAGGEATQVLDQNQGKCNWVYLGEYPFYAGTTGYVYMGDYSGENPWHLIAADGVKFVKVTGSPPPSDTTPPNGYVVTHRFPYGPPDTW